MTMKLHNYENYFEYKQKLWETYLNSFIFRNSRYELINSAEANQIVYWQLLYDKNIAHNF